MNRRGGHTNQLRIIGGQWRGRRLEFPDLPGLRPTPDRVRETLFNWLAPVLPGARCLDLFAGSGALGIEALSCGAAEVVFVERQPRAVHALRENLARLNAAGARVEAVDALAWLRQPGKSIRDRAARSAVWRRFAGAGLHGAGDGRLAGGNRLDLSGSGSGTRAVAIAR